MKSSTGGWMGWINNILLGIVAFFAIQMYIEVRTMGEQLQKLHVNGAVLDQRVGRLEKDVDLIEGRRTPQFKPYQNQP